MKQLESGKYLCPVCKGKGCVYDRFAGILTFLTQMVEDEPEGICPKCGGKGYIEI